MATVQGPLHSKTAQGSFAKQLTYRHTNGQATCRKIGRSTKPLSEAQQLHHAAFSMLAAAWRNASAEDKASWTPLLDFNTPSLYNAFLHFNFARMAAGETTSTVYPPIEIPTLVLHVAPGSPAATPDCSGDYCVIGQLNGQPLYSRYPDYEFTLHYNPTYHLWLIKSVPPSPSGANWYRNTTITGVFTPELYAGSPVLSLIP